MGSRQVDYDKVSNGLLRYNVCSYRECAPRQMFQRFALRIRLKTNLHDTPSAGHVCNAQATERMQGDGLTAMLGDWLTPANARTRNRYAQACGHWCMHHR